MKLRDFVFNSLRVRGKKKKAASPGTVAVGDIPTGCFGLDKNRNWFPSSHSRRRSHGNSFENDGLIDANWQGNALYQGLVITEDVKENCALLALDYSSCDHVQYSHSEMGTSSSFTGFDRNLDNSYSQDTVSENFGSVSSISPVSETETESSSFHQQNYSYHYHHERHNQYTGHHLHSKKVTTLLQEHNQSIDNVQQQGSKNSHNSQKPETGFFRKSLASLKNIRKDSSKTKQVSSKQIGHAHKDCAMGFFPADTSTNKVSVPKMSTKIKHRGSKLFSKSKENKDIQYCTENFENQWAVERGINDDLKAAKVAMDPFISTCMLYDRPYVRETSIESCPARHYSFQEELNTRDFDLTGFELASFSGYESDISRSRGRKARSRIKTNPWLPSPQLSVASRWKEYQVQESNDNIPLLEGDWGFPRPDPLEYHDCDLQPFQAYPTTDSRGYHRKHSSRKSPNGIRMTSNVTTSSPYSVTKRALDQQYNCFASLEVTSSRTSSLNDLSNNTPTIREASPFSPNAEFSLLAENIEQLATNISFEYEDTFDTTMESLSAGKEMCTDDENSQVPKQKVMNQSRVNMTHSPDSGVGGLGYSDVDNNLTPIAQREATEMTVECSMPATHLEAPCKVLKEVSDENSGSGIRNEGRVNSCRDALKPEYCGSTLNNCNISSLSSPRGMNTQSITQLRNGRKENYYLLEENCWSDMANPVYDNKACYGDTHMTATSDPSNGRTLFVEKTYTFMDSKAGHRQSTELDEGQCRNTQIHRHIDELSESRKAVETEVTSHRDIIDVAHAVKQPSGSSMIADETPAVRKSRPNRLQTKPRMFLNNMEKTSGRREQQRSWMDEFDFPRNITASESLESPTENWQWDYQFAMYHSLDAGSPGEQLYRVVLDGGEDTKEDTLDKRSRGIEIEELIVRLVGNNGKINLQQETNGNISMKNSLEDTSNSEKLENGTLDENFEMNDACVQTDFDDDFNAFEDIHSVDDLEEELYDLSEGGQVWLPRENLVVDSWTSCIKQARDSETMLDKCATIRSEERKEQEPADTMCSEESSQHCELRHSVSNTHVYSDTHAAVSLDLQAKNHTKFESNIRKEVIKQLSADARLLTTEKQLDLQSRQKPTIHSNVTKSGKTVHIPIYGSEAHFGNILNQIYISCDSQRIEERPERSLHGSEKIVEFPDTDSSHSEVVHRQGFQGERNANFNVSHKGKSSITTDNIQFPDNTSVSAPRSNTLINYKSNKRILKLERTAELRHVDANGNFVYNRSRLKRSCESLQRCSASKQDNFGDFLITPLNANKAAYLTFEADSPLCRSPARDSSLCRSLVERPLCATPDANPLSRLRLEQMNSLSLNPSCKDETPACWVSPISSPLFTSTLATNCKAVHQYKKNNQVLIEDHDNVIDLFAHGQSQTSSSAAERSLHILNDQLDNAKHFSSTNEKSHEKSEISPDSVYSFAKCPSNTQHEDSTQISLLETLSYSKASCATGNSKSRFPSTPPGTQPTNDSACLAEKVISLCQEKDLIFQKIYEAKQEEVYRKEHRLQIQRKMQAQTREALLQPLIELRNKLEEQSRRLTEKCNISGNSNSPLRFL